MLARLMAVEDLTVEHRANVVTAFFDTEKRILTLPIWKEMSGDIYDMLVAHEIGHALFTPADQAVLNAARDRLNPKHHASAHAFLNICEDVRIERRVKEKYPGSRRCFRAGYEWLVEHQGWLPKDTEKEVNKLRFIDRVNIHFKLGFAARVRFSPEEQILVDELSRVYTWEEMVDVAEKMYRLAQRQKQAEQQPQTQQPDMPQPSTDGVEAPPSTDVPNPDDEDEDGEGNGPKDTRSTEDDTDDGESADSTTGDGDSDGESSDGKSERDKTDNKDESSEDEADGKSKSDESSDEDGDEDGSAGSSGDASDEDGDEDGESDGAGDGGDDGDSETDADNDTDGDDSSSSGFEGGSGQPGDDVAPDMPSTSEDLDNALQNMVDPNAQSREYITLAAANVKGIVMDHKELHEKFRRDAGWKYDKMLRSAKRDLKNFESDSRPIVACMAKRFEMRKAADVHRRSMVSKSGRLNPDRLWAYKMTDDIFLRTTTCPDGTNHGLVMFIDWSSSMSNNMTGTIRQLLNLVMFCRHVNIPFEVFAFSNLYSRGEAQLTKNPGEMVLNDFTLFNWLSSRMRASEFRTAMLHMTMLMGYFKTRRSRSGKYSAVGYDFHLTGTPLDDAIVAAMEIVPQFQRDNNVQIVNTIFLTDGETTSTPIYQSFTASGGTKGTSSRFSYGYSNSGDTIVRDPKTRKEYRVRDFDNSTACLLKMLGDHTGTNVIGFYLIESGGYYSGKSYFARCFTRGTSQKVIDDEWKRLKEQKFAIGISQGYDLYFILPGRDLDTTTTTVSGVSASESFKRSQRSKVVNRVMLHRFIDLIAA